MWYLLVIAYGVEAGAAGGLRAAAAPRPGAGLDVLSLYGRYNEPDR